MHLRTVSKVPLGNLHIQQQAAYTTKEDAVCNHCTPDSYEERNLVGLIGCRRQLSNWFLKHRGKETFENLRRCTPLIQLLSLWSLTGQFFFFFNLWDKGLVTLTRMVSGSSIWVICSALEITGPIAMHHHILLHLILYSNSNIFLNKRLTQIPFLALL